MQALYITLGAIAVLIPGFFIVSLFLPSQMKIVRVKVIAAPPALVFEQIDVVRNWERWSPWFRDDPALVIRYNDTESGQGAACSWESSLPHTGKGAMKIIESRPFEYEAADMQFKEQHTARCQFRLEPVIGGTMVNWDLTAILGQHPLYKLRGLVMDKWLSRYFEAGLANLDTVVRL